MTLLLSPVCVDPPSISLSTVDPQIVAAVYHDIHATGFYPQIIVAHDCEAITMENVQDSTVFFEARIIKSSSQKTPFVSNYK